MPGTSLFQTPVLDFCISGHFINSEGLGSAYFHCMSQSLGYKLTYCPHPLFYKIIHENHTELRFAILNRTGILCLRILHGTGENVQTQAQLPLSSL